jgi:UDP-N-acetylmuramate--alanine ligase
VPFYGTVIVFNDDDHLRDLLPNVQRRVVTYGTRPGSDFLISEIETSVPADGPACRFRVHARGSLLGDFHLHVPGMHNVLNATAAIAVATGLDLPAEKIREALESFRGVDRRFQVRGRAAGVTVVDDYGHHPTEIRATLAAARQCGFRRVHVIFQPHRYTRTEALLEEFGGAFADADRVLVLDIYPASEQPIEGINGELVAQKIRQAGGREAVHVGSFAAAAAAVADAAQDGDLVLTLGAGNISQLGPQVLERLQARAPTPV